MKTIKRTNLLFLFSVRFAVAMLAFSMLFFSNAQAQTAQQKNKEKMQQQMQQLQKEIKQIQSVINATSTKKKRSMGELESLLAKIKSREKLIKNLKSQLDELDKDISSTQKDIDNQNKRVKEMKAQYAEMLRKTYRNLTLQNELLFLVSSSSFQEAISRYGILKRAADFRRIQAKQLQAEIDNLEVKKKILETEKEEQQQIFSEENKQQEKLMHDKREQSNIVAKLNVQEKGLRKKFNQKQQSIKNLNKRIEAIIAEEIRLAREKAAKDKAAKADSKDAIPLTPAEKTLSTNFANNMGKLPWPVVRGHIVSSFGKHAHPTLSGVQIENNGIDIKTTAGSDALALFDGVVVSVFSLPTINTCVMIKHGEFFTVYSNIDKANVKTGDKVSTKQALGKLADSSDDATAKIHIEIWKGKEKMNPELWLATN